ADKIFPSAPGGSAAWHSDDKDATWTLDPTRRWATAIGPMGLTVFDLRSHGQDQSVSFYYFRDYNDEIGRGGIAGTSVAITPDGKRLAAFKHDTARGQFICVWDHPGFPTVSIDTEGYSYNNPLAFFADGQLIVCGERVW